MNKIQENHNEQSSLEQGEEVSSNQHSSDYIIPKNAGRKQLCTFCQSALYKYTCPKCQQKTCGLTCLQKHKIQRGCSGIADPNQYVQKNQIGEKQVEKDFSFVKQMLSSSDKVKKTMSGLHTLSLQPKRFKILRSNAKKQCNITLINAPNIIERHRENISFFFMKTKQIFWVLQFLYFRGFNQNKIVCEKQTTLPQSDQKKLIDLIPKDYLCRQLLEIGVNTQKIEQFLVFTQKMENSRSKKKTILEVQKNKTVRENITGSVIFQFPTFILVHESLRQEYIKNIQKIKSFEI